MKTQKIYFRTYNVEKVIPIIKKEDAPTYQKLLNYSTDSDDEFVREGRGFSKLCCGRVWPTKKRARNCCSHHARRVILDEVFYQCPVCGKSVDCITDAKDHCPVNDACTHSEELTHKHPELEKYSDLVYFDLILIEG